MSKPKRLFLEDYRRLFAFTRPHLKIFVLAAACMLFSTIFDGVTIGMIAPLSDKILTNGQIVVPAKLPAFAERLVAFLNDMPRMKLLYGMSVFVVVLFFLKGLFAYLQAALMSAVGQRVLRDIRLRLYTKFQELDLEYFSQKRSGELISRITHDIDMIQNAVSYGFTDLIYQSLQIVLFSAIIIVVYWKLAFVALLMIPFISVPIVLVGKKLRKISRATQEKMADINSLLVETISGVRIVRAFGVEDHEIEKFRRQSGNYYELKMKTIMRTLALGPATEFIGVIGGVFILVFVGRQVVLGTLSFGVFGLFMGSVMMMIRPFKKLSSVNSIMQGSFAASTRIYEVLDIKPKVADDPLAWECDGIKEGIEYRDVWFRYEEAQVLKGIDLKCRKGELIALVGPSGAGKSTLVDLLARFYDPQKGSILLDGRDIRTFQLKTLRKQIAMVTQETILFNDSVRDNIAYGRRDATFEEIVRASKSAFAHDFIENLPKGYDTYIGDRGVKLSGGERQRLSIARAILKDPPLLILDEATSQLDSQSERLVQEALNTLMQGRTVFVIAHRIATVKHATRIVVLHEGRIVEEGTHEELLARGGLYKRLHDMQFQA